MGISNLLTIIKKREDYEPREINSDNPQVITDIELKFHFEISKIIQEMKKQTLNPTPNPTSDISLE